ncbi:hypothetical protein BBK82_44165 [Lentzea guizhouensis]|uniref:Exo-alpha-sialidase n=1 Tax=Lentzea guizhouensis TaxID=1586287 RepID=A0A1B2HVY5_9PSEU|nr:hypothetical protein [Lentzea guizhouensis]ANZ41899.1 hypothetical protein BBK82_44165 [Lentzea guizhouensis]
MLRLVLAAMLLLAACSSPPPPPEFTPPTWTRQTVPTLPHARLDSIHGAVGWNGGFVIAGSYTEPAPPNDEGRVNNTPAVLHMSADGQTWREVIPPDIGDLAWGDAAAARGDHAYVLGHTGVRPVLLTSEGGVWTKLELPGGVFTDKPTSIGAGPRGVVVVGFANYRMGDKVKGLRLWFSPDGREFGDPVVLTTQQVYTGYLPRVLATDTGFLVYGAMPSSGRPERRAELLFESADGRDWRAAGDELPDPPDGQHHDRLTAAQHNNGTTVLFGSLNNPDNPEDSDTGLTGWYRRAGESSWTQLADIDPGKLPDAGVVPKPQRRVDHVVKWQSGFLALGATRADAAVWTSPDGLTWTKMPVRDNGFEGTGPVDHLSDGGLGLLVNLPEGDGPARVWRSGSPTARPATNHPVPKGGAWQGILGTSITIDDTGGGEIRYSDFKVANPQQFLIKFRHVGITAGGTRTADVTESTDPAVPAGGTLSAKVEANGPTVLFPDGTQREFCGADRYSECS